ncbi:MAG: hypothetical protein WBN32_08610 [Woeseia sp.]
MGTKTIVATVIGLTMTAAFADQGMKKADADNDGQISLSEFRAAHEQRIEERFARLDLNADGLISDDEMQAAPRDRKGAEGKQRRHRKGMNPEKLIERMDSDGSGGVSLQELEGKRFSPDSTTFVAADVDGSGELSAEELSAMMKAHRAERRGADRNE